MKYEEILAAFQQASAFDLYRLRTLLDRVLDDAKRINPIKTQLRLGQQISFFNPSTQQEISGTLLEFRRKDVIVQRAGSLQHWSVPYVAINVEGIDVKIREHHRVGLSPHEVAVGDTVGFLGRDQQQMQGRVLRINDKTVTLISNGAKWRVSYALLHRILSTEDGHDIL